MPASARSPLPLGLERRSGQPGRTLQEIASLLGLSRERVRQIQAGAISRLRELGLEMGLFDGAGI